LLRKKTAPVDNYGVVFAWRFVQSSVE